jgi:hypothetical protein
MLIHRMHAPLWQGILHLSHRVDTTEAKNGKTAASGKTAESSLPIVFVVLDIEDLRAEGFFISCGLS